MLTRLSDKDLGWRTCVWHDMWTSFACAFALAFAHTSHLCEQGLMGPLQLAIHVVQNHRAEEQKSHWDKTNKGNYHLKLCNMSCLSCPSATFALQRGDFVPREWLAAKSLLSVSEHNIHSFQLDVIRTWQFLCDINSILEIIINYHGQLYPLVARTTGASGELGEERSETGERVKGLIH